MLKDKRLESQIIKKNLEQEYQRAEAESKLADVTYACGTRTLLLMVNMRQATCLKDEVLKFQ